MAGIMVESAPTFRLQALPLTALHMLRMSLPVALVFVAGNVALTTLSMTVLRDMPMVTAVSVIGGLALYCYWLRTLYRSVDLGPSEDRPPTTVLRLMWAHVLVAFILAMALTVLLLGTILALQVMLIAAGMNEENFPETTEAFLAFMMNTGVIWPAGALLAFLSAGFVYLSVRLWLFSAATIDHSAVRVFQTWPWTKGRALKLGVAVGAFVILPLILGETLYRSLFGWAEVTVQDSGEMVRSIGFAEALIRAVFQSAEVFVPALFTAAIAATAYRAWGQPAHRSEG